MLKTPIIATLAVMAAATASHASVFDFNDPDLQDTLVSSVTTSDGAITASLTTTDNVNRFNDGSVNSALIFNAADGGANDNDPDLQFIQAGGVLVIAENDLSGGQLPDDNANGGTITFDFVEAVTLSSFSIYDDGTLTVTGNNGATFSASVADDGDFANFVIGDDRFAGVTSLTFDFGNASGAIDDIVVSLTAVPLPAGLPLMLVGMGALGIAARRKKAA